MSGVTRYTIAGLFFILISTYFLIKLELRQILISETFQSLQAIKSRALPRYSPFLSLEETPYFVSSLLEIKASNYDQDLKNSIEKCVKNERIVQMYQWEETATERRDEEGNSIGTDYSYHQVWSQKQINSAFFYNSFLHTNPPMILTSEVKHADSVKVLDWSIDEIFLDQINWKSHSSEYQYYRIKNAIITNPVYEELTDHWVNQIGDYRVYYNCYGQENSEISILGQPTEKGNITEYSTPHGPSVALLEKGQVSEKELLRHARRKVHQNKWLWRLLSTAVCFIGLLSLHELVGEICINITWLTKLNNTGALIRAGFLSICWSIFVISLQWMSVTPIASTLFIATVCIFLYGIFSFS